MKEKVKTNNLELASIIANKEILSFKEALMYLDVSSSSLYKLTSKKAIKFSKPNKGKLYFLKKDLDEWMTQNMSCTNEDLENQVMSYLNRKRNEN